MRTSRKLAAYAAVLAAVFGASVAAGAAVGPTGLTNVEPDRAGHGAMPAGMAPPGLASSDNGLRLAPDQVTQPLGRTTPYRFRILDDRGTVTDFDVTHTKRMHLIVVRRDLTGFQHLHPSMAADGTWQVPLTLDRAGAFRVFADFAVDGDKHTLGTDLFVGGDFQPEPLPAVNRVADVGDGYAVELRGATQVGRESELAFVVRHRGAVVTHLPLYLGARGHLVALRSGDLAYLHVHADADRLAFEAAFPTAGTYRLFLQFRHGGRVRTAAFTVHTTEESR